MLGANDSPTRVTFAAVLNFSLGALDTVAVLSPAAVGLDDTCCVAPLFATLAPLNADFGGVDLATRRVGA